MSLSRPPAAVLTAVAVVVLLVAGATTALSAPSLPPIEADQLLASMLEAERPEAVSGELTATLGLGLPALPDDDGGLADLLGTMRLRVERSPDGMRIAQLQRSSERLLVTDGETLSTWDSRTFTVTQMQVPEHGPADGKARHDGFAKRSMDDLDPTTVAQRLLAVVSEHATVAVDGTARVAGRPAYRLALTPTDGITTIGRIEVDVDDETRMPLRTALYARGASAPTMELAWSRVSFAPIDPSVFAFTPPPGATVTEPGQDGSTTERTSPPPAALLFALSDALPDRPLVGSGFSTVAVVPVPPPSDDASDRRPGRGDDGGFGDLAALLPLDGPLLSVRLAQIDGRPFALVGFVPLSHLDEVAADLTGPPAP